MPGSDHGNPRETVHCGAAALFWPSSGCPYFGERLLWPALHRAFVLPAPSQFFLLPEGNAVDRQASLPAFCLGTCLISLQGGHQNLWL